MKHLNKALGFAPRLTKREKETLHWMLAGFGIKKTAELMKCSIHTVRIHWANMIQRYGVRSRETLIYRAFESGQAW